MKRPPPRTRGIRPWLLPALATGVLLGMAFPPVGASWFVWVGLIPLLWAVRYEKRGSRAFWIGLVAGTVVHLMTLRALVSAHPWSGWQFVPVTELAGIQSRQLMVLNGLWLLLSVSCGVFWGVFALALCKLGRGSLNRMAVRAPPSPAPALSPVSARSLMGYWPPDCLGALRLRRITVRSGRGRRDPILGFRTGPDGSQ